MEAQAWEDTKENYVPVKQGRSAAALATPLSVKKRNTELDEAKQAFVQAIKAAEDPLPAWLRYIKWTQEQFAAQGSKAELQQVLEAATKSLSSTDRYNCDVRLLRIWIQYADCLPDPSDVFLYLENHGIGRDHALLYEAYATYLELKGNYQQAELVYQEGINRLAKPLERLKQKQAAFQQRMAKRIQRQTSEALLGMDTAAAAAAAGPARATLAPVLAPLDAPLLDENGRPIRASSSRQQQQQRRLPPQAASVAAGVRNAGDSSQRQQPLLWGSSTAAAAAAPATGGLFGLGQGAPSSSSRGMLGSMPPSQAGLQAAPAANGGKLFEVLVDEEFGLAGSGPAPSAFPSSQQQQQHSQLPGYAVSRKENTTEPGQWAGAKLKQQSAFTAPTASRLEVYEDEELAEPQDAPPAAQQQQGSIRQQLDAPAAPAAPAAPVATAGLSQGQPTATAAAAAAALSSLGLQAPSRQQKQQDVAAGSTAQPTASSSARSGAAAAATAAGGPHGYNEALLVGPDGSEMSFEEVRAAAWRARRTQQRELEQQQQQQQLERKRQQQREQQQQEQQLREQQQKQQEQQRREQQQQQQLEAQKRQQQEQQRKEQQQLEQQEQRQRNQRQQQAFAAAAAAPSAVASEPTVTVNTRAALDSLNMMFSSDLPTMTLPKNAISSAAAAYPAPAGAAGFRSSSSSTMMLGRKSMGGGGAGASEPTVTVNTRAALDAMNGMFGGADDTTTMHGFSAGPRGAAGPGGFGRYGGSGFGSGVPGRGSAAEPTVTINTRAAFDYMNDMFGDMTGQQTMTGRQMVPGRGDRRVGSSRLSMAAPAAAGGPLGVYEDTELLQCIGGSKHGHAGQAAAGGSGGNLLGLYEDTEFVGSRLAGANAAGGMGGGLGLLEDTEFITRDVGGAAGAARSGFGGGAAGSGGGGGLCLHEDTEFVTRPVGGAAGASSGRGGLCLHEDTEYITRHVGGGNVGPSGGALGLYEDTEFVGSKLAGGGTGFGGAAAASAGSGLGLLEDTEFITRDVAGGSAAGSTAAGGFGRAGGSSRPRLPDEGSDSTTGLLRVKENLPAAASQALLGGHRVPLGQAAAAAPEAAHSSSRGGSFSQPSSPAPHAAHHHGSQQHHPGPAWGAVTPGKPPAGPGAAAAAGSTATTPARSHPGTPGTPWARPLEEFHVMESPEVRAAMAGRPPVVMSPATSMPSPGLGAHENNPVDDRGEPLLPPRSMHDRAARAAALQPLSDMRAELLGVRIEPEGAGDDDYEAAAAGDGENRSRLGRPQGRALRSLRFQPGGH